jgi:hypothetical protein
MQYVFFFVVVGLVGRLAAAPSGAIAARLGWPAFFAASAVVGVAAVAVTLAAPLDCLQRKR